MTYRWNGPYWRGYMKTVREGRRAEAEERNAATPVERTAKFNRKLARLDRAATR